MKINPSEIVSEVHKHTNLCIYHFAGICPHVECCYSHEEKAAGLLIKAIAAMNDNLPADCHQSMPSDLEEVKVWKDRVYQIFLLHTGKGQTDIHKLVKNLIMAGGNPELTIRAARIIR